MAIEDGFFVLECDNCYSRLADPESDFGYATFDSAEKVDEAAKKVDWPKIAEHKHLCVPCNRKKNGSIGLKAF